jgi:two-component system, OmpR family, response regulator
VSHNRANSEGLRDVATEVALTVMRVLVIEDDPKIREYVVKGLSQHGYAADGAADGDEGLEMALTGRYAAAVVDLMLPGSDGYTIIETMRREKVPTAVLVLSAKQSVEDRVHGLQIGADDFVPKPFAMSELLARLEAVLRRSYQHRNDSERLESHGVAMDVMGRTVRRNGSRIDLQPREFALLELLMRNEGRVFSKTYLLERLWDYSFDPQTNVVDVLVCRLRNKIDRDYEPKLIHTIRGVGYVFRAE